MGARWGRRRAVDAPAPTAPEHAEVPDRGERIVEHHPVGVVVAGRAGAEIYRNAAARELRGTHVGALVGEAIARHVELAFEHGESQEVLEFFGPPKVVLVLHAHAVQDEAVVYLDDVSERHRVDQVRTDFVANISHELKTPVGAMSVLAETLEDETDPATIARVARRIIAEAQRATRTIDDLMELSRVEAGGHHDFEPIRVAEIVAGAMDRVIELAARRDIGVANLAAADQLSGVVVIGDRRQVISALGNLVENAVKYTEPGGQVQIRTRVAAGSVEFSVIDEGVGVPQRDLDRIFERFYRVDRARSRETGGTGLGLSIVRHVASNHGGDVSVTSTEGEGSVFTFLLPVTAESRSDDGVDKGIA